MSTDFSTYSRGVAKVTRWCLDHTKTTVGVATSLLLLSVFFISKIQVDSSPETYMEGAPAWNVYEQINRSFGVGETIVIAVRESGGTIFDADSVRTIAQIDEKVSEIQAVKRVLSIASASVIGNVGSAEAVDTIDVGRLLPSGPITPQSARILGERIVQHQIYPKVLVDKSHETTFLLVQLDPELSTRFSRLDLARNIRDIADSFATEDRSIHLGGPPMTKEAIAHGVLQDTKTFIPATFVLLFVLLFLMFGDVLVGLISITSIGFSTMVVVGWLGMIGSSLNMATVLVPVIILVIGLADNIHLLVELRRQFSRKKDRKEALIATVEALALPCLLTSITSAIGFLVLVNSGIGPLRSLGAGAALGLTLAYAASMFLTPVLLLSIRYPKQSSREFVGAPKMGRALTNFAVLTGKNVFFPVGVTGLLLGICFATLNLLEVNSDFIGYLPPEHRLRKDIDIIGHTLGGSDTLEVVIRSKKEGTFLDPTLLKHIAKAEVEVRKLDGIHGVLSFVDYLKLANSLLDPERGYAIPLTRNAVSQVMLLEAEGFPALASPDMKEIRMSIQVPNMTSEEVRKLVYRIKTTAESSLNMKELEVVVTGIPLLFADVVNYFVKSAASSFAFIIFILWIAMIFGFKNFMLSTVALIPSVLPIGMTYATMVLLGLNFDANSAIVGYLGLGIAVDDTIHVITRYQRAREQGAPTTTRALRYALTHAGHPVVLTSVLLVVGFLVLALSSFVPTVRIGLLGAMLVLYAGLLDLCLLPSLLIGVDRLTAQFEPKVQSRPSPLTGDFTAASSRLTSLPSTFEEDEF
ncbi:MAG: MMPL family transporter [Myxococcota bacterium]|nr:MMPL family transporter [Myxococcota bacterium]